MPCASGPSVLASCDEPEFTRHEGGLRARRARPCGSASRTAPGEPWLNIMSGPGCASGSTIASSLRVVDVGLERQRQHHLQAELLGAAVARSPGAARPTSESAWKKPTVFSPVLLPQAISARNSSRCSARTGNTIGWCGRRRLGEPAIGPKNGTFSSAATFVDRGRRAALDRAEQDEGAVLRPAGGHWPRPWRALLSSSSVRSTMLAAVHAAGGIDVVEVQLDAAVRRHAVAVLAALQRDVLADDDLAAADAGLGGERRHCASWVTTTRPSSVQQGGMT